MRFVGQIVGSAVRCAPGQQLAKGSCVVWFMTGAGWLLVGVVAGWHTVDFIPYDEHLRASICGLLGAVGGIAGGAGITVFGVGTADPGWILSLVTCVVGAVCAVLLASVGVSWVVRIRRRL